MQVFASEGIGNELKVLAMDVFDCAQITEQAKSLDPINDRILYESNH